MPFTKQICIRNLCAWIEAGAILGKRSDNFQSPCPGDMFSEWYLALNPIQDDAGFGK